MSAISPPTFTHISAFVTFVTGVLLPSADVYSDIGLSVKLLNKSCDECKHYGQYNYCSNNSCSSICNNFTKYPQERVQRSIEIQKLFGRIIWIPIIINLLFTIPHYLRIERTWTQRLLTLPFLICQCWPQYRSMRVLWFAYVRHNITKCVAEKLQLEQNIYTLGRILSIWKHVSYYSH